MFSTSFYSLKPNIFAQWKKESVKHTCHCSEKKFWCQTNVCSVSAFSRAGMLQESKKMHSFTIPFRVLWPVAGDFFSSWMQRAKWPTQDNFLVGHQHISGQFSLVCMLGETLPTREQRKRRCRCYFDKQGRENVCLSGCSCKAWAVTRGIFFQVKKFFRLPFVTSKIWDFFAANPPEDKNNPSALIQINVLPVLLRSCLLPF